MKRIDQLSAAERERIERMRGKEFLAADVPPETLDAERRTVDIVFFTGADVFRYDYWNDEVYIRRFSAKGADFSYLNNGAPVFDNHWSWDGSASQKGRVEKAWQDKVYKATLRFSKRPDVDGIWTDIQDKIITKFSMGVEVLEEKKYTEEAANGDPIRVREATKWRPFEISIAPLPADFGTTTLSAEVAPPIQADTPPAATEETREPATEVALADERASAQKETQMVKETEKPAAGADVRTENPAEPAMLAGVAPAVISTEALQAAAKNERASVLEIMKIAKSVGIDDTFVTEQLAAGTDVATFKNKALEELARRHKEQPGTRTASAEITMDAGDNMRVGIIEALMHRHNPSIHNITEAGKPFYGLSLLDIARECLRAKGINFRGMAPWRIAELAAQSTSDFPYVMAATAETTLRGGYAMEESQWRLISARRTARNLKLNTELDVDLSANLEKVPESGEYKRGSFVEGKETWQVFKYGKIVSMTLEMIINDQLEAFSRAIERYGRKVAMNEADLVWAQLTGNGNMTDGVALFAAGHNNLITGPGTVISDTNIGILRTKVRVQTDPGGNVIGLNPKYLVAPTAKEQLALQYTSSAYVPATPTTQNVYAGTLKPITEPRLDASSTTAWYLFVEPGVEPVLVYGYLEGYEGPRVSRREGFEIDGVDVKVQTFFGAGKVGFRGAAKNDGV